ncbi:Transcription factor IIIC subunit 5 [Trinorchestia longiramus]|nr:Transcription factor IIIC subunit 5 [Trinorchestia longiramus]
MDPRVTEKSDVVYSEAGRVPEYVCVEYPGHVTSVDDMLETLGGLDMISHVYSDVNRRLELRFRPSDSYCKPACATRASATGLLVRVTRRVKKKKLQKAPCATASSSVVQPTEATKSSSSAAAQPCHSEEFRSTLLGVVRTSYTFNSELS